MYTKNGGIHLKLQDIFTESIKDAQKLVLLYDALLTTNERSARADWTDRFYDSKLTSWPKKEGLWRAKNTNILIVGRENGSLSHGDFKADSLCVLLKSALVLSMASIDKILHEAIVVNFRKLAKDGMLDKFAQIDVSKCYEIAEHAGRTDNTRPGHMI
jgi:hypothetical protein